MHLIETPFPQQYLIAVASAWAVWVTGVCRRTRGIKRKARSDRGRKRKAVTFLTCEDGHLEVMTILHLFCPPFPPDDELRITRPKNGLYQSTTLPDRACNDSTQRELHRALLLLIRDTFCQKICKFGRINV